jgi:hypothetical protein
VAQAELEHKFETLKKKVSVQLERTKSMVSMSLQYEPPKDAPRSSGAAAKTASRVRLESKQKAERETRGITGVEYYTVQAEDGKSQPLQSFLLM